MKGIRRFLVAAALIASMLMPTLRFVGGPSLAGLHLDAQPVWACENPLPSGECG